MPSHPPGRCVVLLAVTASLGLAADARGGEKVYVGRNVPASQSVLIDRISHATLDTLLKKYVDAAGNVNYAAWLRSSADMRALDAYLAHLSTADPRRRASRRGTLAFWINAYNAVTIKGILREYPTTSIRNHTARLFGYNIWKDLLLIVGGAGFGLEQIEHEILRKLHEPRIHFAIVCASRSCPKLRAEAYTAERLEEQLVLNTRDFFATASNFRHDVRSRRFYLSAVMNWFDEDFGRDQAAQLRTIAPYLPTSAARQAAEANSVSVSYLSYDWDLNDQANLRSARR